MKHVIIRQENQTDFPLVFNLIKASFENEIHTDHQEQYLVERLRKSVDFIPELSLVAENQGNIVGYILLSKIKILSQINNPKGSLALAPVAVLPQYQNQGIGGRLIATAHEKAKNLGFDSVIVLGHESFYPKFGYVTAENFNIKSPFDVPSKNFMAIELVHESLKSVEGIVEYPKEFS